MMRCVFFSGFKVTCLWTERTSVHKREETVPLQKT
jgi:hypothetical protein